MTRMYIVIKKNAYHKPAINIVSYKTFILKNLRISMASFLKYFNPCWLLDKISVKVRETEKEDLVCRNFIDKYERITSLFLSEVSS